MISMAKHEKKAGVASSLAKKFDINKSKVLTSLLAGFAAPFLLLVCSVFSVYFNNSDELPFAVKDFLPMLLGAFFVVFAIISCALIFTKGVLRNSIFAIVSGFTICAYIQSVYTQLTFSGLPGDGNAEIPGELAMVINFTIWVVLLAVALWFGVLSNKAQTGRNVLCFMLVLVLVMQIVSVVPSAIEFGSKKAEEAQEYEKTTYYLTNANMFELSSKDNVVVFVLDRFDARYYDQLLEFDSEFFKDFDGFTYYNDNISKFPRTYPAITTMLTGVDNDFSTTREDYYTRAYRESSFLRDMKNNNYKINLYIPAFYSYEDARVFGDTVSNVSFSRGYAIDNGRFASALWELSSYFWAPEILKSQSISSSTFNGIVSLDGDSSAPLYEMTKTSDSEIYTKFAKEGISLQNNQNTFSFIHLRGCHSPFTMDENCNVVTETNYKSLEQTRGCFKLVSEYIQQMKDLGIYENSTIIITGDHAALASDRQEYTDENLTALLVKEKGQHSTPLKTSSAQVSQDSFIASIVKSSGIETSNDYGKAYWEIPEGKDQVRTHYYQNIVGTSSDRQDVNVTYEITGKGSDFSNWKITNREEIGYLYK